MFFCCLYFNHHQYFHLRTLHRNLGHSTDIILVALFLVAVETDLPLRWNLKIQLQNTPNVIITFKIEHFPIKFQKVKNIHRRKRKRKSSKLDSCKRAKCKDSKITHTEFASHKSGKAFE